MPSGKDAVGSYWVASFASHLVTTSRVWHLAIPGRIILLTPKMSRPLCVQTSLAHPPWGGATSGLYTHRKTVWQLVPLSASMSSAPPGVTHLLFKGSFSIKACLLGQRLKWLPAGGRRHPSLVCSTPHCSPFLSCWPSALLEMCHLAEQAQCVA